MQRIESANLSCFFFATCNFRNLEHDRIGQASRLHPGSRIGSTRCPLRSLTKRTGRNGIRLAGRMRWMAPRPPGCQRADRHHTNRRRHKPALSRAEGTNRRSGGQASRLHPGSRIGSTRCRIRSVTNSTGRNGIRLAGRMRCLAPASARQAGPTKRIGNRVVNEPRGITPIAEGTNRLSAGRAGVGKRVRNERNKPARNVVFFAGLQNLSHVCRVPDWAQQDSNL